MAYKICAHCVNWQSYLDSASCLFMALTNLACSRRSDSRGRQSVGSELNCTLGKEGRGGGGVGGESEGMPVKIVNKGSFRYTGFQYTLLLVDYDTFC